MRSESRRTNKRFPIRQRAFSAPDHWQSNGRLVSPAGAAATPRDLEALAAADEKAWLNERQAHLGY